MIGLTQEECQDLVTKYEKFAFDIESTGTNKRKDFVIGFGIATRTGTKPSDFAGAYIPMFVFDDRTGDFHRTEDYDFGLQILGQLLNKKLVTWNGSFDTTITANTFSIDLLPALHCEGMLLAHTVNENEYEYSLKGLGKRIFGVQAGAAEEELKNAVQSMGGKWTKENKEFYKAPIEVLGKYCIQDCILTLKLVEHFEEDLHEQELAEFFYNDETMPLYRHFTIPAERNGILLDMPLLLNAQKEIEADIKRIETSILAKIHPHLDIFKEWLLNKDYPPSRSGAFVQEFCELLKLPLPRTKAGNYSLTEANIAKLPDNHAKAVLLKQEYMTPDEVALIQQSLWLKDGQPWFNLQSKHHLKKLFFDTLKETPLSTTEKGAPQADDEFLEKMAQKYDWAAELRTFNRLQKLKGTYIDRFIDASDNGRFYPSFQQHRTISGRLAGDLQQLPRPIENPSADDVVAKYQNLIRAFFIADKDYVFIDDDYESAEPRTFAHISGEDSLKNIFAAGHDFYSTIAIRTESLQDVSADKKAPNYLGKVNKAKRQSAKTYSLGIPYGLTGYKLQFELNIPLSDAERLVKGYLDSFPNLSQQMKQAHEEALTNGFVRTEAGRIRHLGRAKEIFAQYGSVIMDDLELWKKFHEMPGLYARAKQHRRELKNLLNNAFNFKVQGLVANTINRATIAAAKEFEASKLRAKIIANIHDELIVHAHKDDAEEAAKILQRCMETAWPISVPMVATPSFGANFRDAKGA